MKRPEFTAKVMVAAFERSNGKCEKCRAPLAVGKTHYDHVLPCALGGSNAIENCAVLCVGCHQQKTSSQDVPAIAKVKRIRAKHIGARKPTGFRKPPAGSRWDWRLGRRVFDKEPA